MAGTRIFALVSATHTTAIAGARYARITPVTVTMKDPINKRYLITLKELVVELFGQDARALMAKIGAAAANLVLATKGASGAAESHTLKLVQFDEVIGDAELPAMDGGGKLPVAGIRGKCKLAATDTFALAWT